MNSKNKPSMTVAERLHVGTIRNMPCVICEAEGPSEAHEPEQGLWMISMPLCPACHRRPEGWHGTRARWKLRKMTELKAINLTIKAVLK